MNEAVERGEVRTAASQLMMVVDSLRQMEALVRELHAESVLRSNPTAMGVIPLSSMVNAARTNLAPLIESSGARIVAGTLPEVTGSRTMLIQLFINLFENSIKYRSGEPVVIKVSASRDRECHRIRISDNGMGIPANERERIFEPGVRGGHTAGLPGTGLGLSFCQRIMEAHGGTITVVEMSEKGAVFELGFETRSPVGSSGSHTVSGPG